jgi:hypothetical protein
VTTPGPPHYRAFRIVLALSALVAVVVTAWVLVTLIYGPLL